MEIYEYIIYFVCKFYKTNKKAIKIKSNKPEYIKPKHMIYTLARELTDLSCAKIGEQFGQDHSTVSTAVRTFTGYIKTNKRLRIEHDNIYKEITDHISKNTDYRFEFDYETTFNKWINESEFAL